MKPVYGVPAVLSLVFPGLGQLVKTQYKRAAVIWTLMLLPWIMWVLIAVISGSVSFSAPADIYYALSRLLQSSFYALILAANLVVHLWQVVDAYNCPRDFDLS